MSSGDEILASVIARPWPTGTSARVVSAVEYAAVPEKVWQDSAGEVEPVKRALFEMATDVSNHAVEQLQRAGITAEAIVKVDDPRFVIGHEASEWQADLILIRAHTYTNLSRWLLGSVAGAVLRDAPCSVEIVRATVEWSEKAARDGLKIVLGLDESDFSFAAVQSVASRPWPDGTRVRLISVIEPVVYFAEQITDPPQVVSESLQLDQWRAESLLSERGINVTSEIVSGNPKETIVDQAKAWDADLVVVGSHGRRGLKRWLLGSVSEAVATHAHCSVEVIRSAKPA